MKQPEGWSISFGDSEEWKKFVQRHGLFAEKLDDLTATITNVLSHSFTVETPAQEIVHFFGPLAVEDFMEILLLCGNGYGVGALKILRGLYERTVTAAYIAKHPDTAERFLDFGSIQMRRMLNQAKELYGTNVLRQMLSPGKMESIEAEYQAVKDKFLEPLCKTCDTTRMSFSWSSLDTASMARKAGYCLDKLYHLAFMIPTPQAHATVLSLTSRMRTDEHGLRYFNSAAQHDEADAALSTAHGLILVMLSIQNDYFKSGKDAEIAERNAEYLAIWKRESTTTQLHG